MAKRAHPALNWECLISPEETCYVSALGAATEDGIA
jgi:hypothetical protein